MNLRIRFDCPNFKVHEPSTSHISRTNQRKKKKKKNESIQNRVDFLYHNSVKPFRKIHQKITEKQFHTKKYARTVYLVEMSRFFLDILIFLYKKKFATNSKIYCILASHGWRILENKIYFWFISFHSVVW